MGWFVAHEKDVLTGRIRKRFRLRGGLTLFAIVAVPSVATTVLLIPKEQPKPVLREYVRTAVTLAQVKGAVQNAKACLDAYAVTGDKTRYTEKGEWFCRVNGDECTLTLGAPALLHSSMSIAFLERDADDLGAYNIGKRVRDTTVRMMLNVEPKIFGFRGVTTAQMANVDFLARYTNGKMDAEVNPVMATYPAAHDPKAVGAVGTPDQMPVAQDKLPDAIKEISGAVPSLEKLCFDPRFKTAKPAP